MFRRLAYATTLSAALLASNTAWSDRPLMKTDLYQAFVDEGDRWCGGQVSVTVRADDAALSFECPDARAISLIGRVDGRTVYQGVANERYGWRLATRRVAPQPSSTIQTTQQPAMPSTTPPVKAEQAPQNSNARANTTKLPRRSE